jgi:2Fe-2S ferredoxin
LTLRFEAAHVTTAPQMTTVRFLPSGFETQVKVGAALVDTCDEHPESEVPFSCRSASCGTCRVRVKEGADLLSKPQDDELDVLSVFGDGKDVRLACQVQIKGEGKITLEVIEPA